MKPLAQSMALIAVAVGVSLATAARPAPADVGELEDAATPLLPKVPRSARDEDRLVAAAQFAHGRMLFQRQDFKGALRRYQRAWRLDSEATSILREIVPLAFDLKHNAEAARYAVLLAEREPRDALLLRRLAMHLTEENDFARALRLYEKAAMLKEKDKPDGTRVLMHLEMGRLYLLQEQYKQSAAAFAVVRDALDDPGRFGLSDKMKKLVLGRPYITYTLIAESFLKAERFDDALAAFHKADEATPNKGLLALHMARIEAAQGHHDKAAEQLQHYLDAKLSVGGSEPYKLLEAFLLKENKGDKEKARGKLIERLAELFKNDPGNAALGYFLADQYHQGNSLDEAAKIYQALLKLQPNLGGFRGLIDVRRQQKDVAELLDVFAAAVTRTGTLTPLGKEAQAVADDAALVDKIIAEARRRQGDGNDGLKPDAALAAALLAVAAKKFEAGHELFPAATAVEKTKKGPVMLTWALELLMADQNEAAAKVLQQAIDEKAVAKDNAGAYFYLAGALEMAGQTDAAIEAAEKAADISRQPRFRSRLPWILYHAKRYDAAEKAYRRLMAKLDSDHDSPGAREVAREVWMVLSNLCVIEDRMEEAEEYLERVLDEFPEDIGAMNDLGYLWADQGKHLERSLVMITRAVKAEPDNAAYRDSLGWAFYRLGRFEEAVKELEKAAGEDDPDAVILDHLGDAYLKAGDNAKALPTWRRAAEKLEQDKDEKKLKEVREKIQRHESQ